MTPPEAAHRSPEAPSLEPFDACLVRHGAKLHRARTTNLQVNVGLRCNQACRHCHQEAGPARREAMGPETMEAVAAYAERAGFATIDITGGAPELVAGIGPFVERLAATAPRLLFRSNLTALAGREELVEVLAASGAAVVASFPSLSRSQADSQRGAGSWKASLRALERLNTAGYGREGTGLELDLVSNPAGAFLPPPQGPAEERFRLELERRWGVRFNHLYAFANVPLGRFRRWLEASGNLDPYLRRLAGAFNPCAVDGVMCRTLVSVGWDGFLHDCDFNLAAGLPLGGRRTHVSELAGPPAAGSAVATGEHCYACTAGSGFT
jgi:radical SAM/Cys-rich protein